jgi:hypothetical protein
MLLQSINWPSWTRLREFASSPLVALSPFFTVIGHFIIFSQEARVFLNTWLSSGGTFLSFESKLFFAFWGLLCLCLFRFLFDIWIPSEIKKNHTVFDYVEFHTRCSIEVQVRDADSLERKLTADELGFKVQKFRNYLELFREAKQDAFLRNSVRGSDALSRTMIADPGVVFDMHKYSYEAVKLSKPDKRICCYLSFLLGFTFLLIPTLDTIIQVVFAMVR